MKKIIALIIFAVALYFFGTDRIRSIYYSEMDRIINDVEQRFTPASIMTNMDTVREFLKISQARLPDLVYSIVLDNNNHPLLVANVSTPAIKEFLYSSREINMYLQKLVQNPKEFFQPNMNRFISHPGFGTFYLKPVQINAYRMIIVFHENSLKRNLKIFYVTLGFIFFIMLTLGLLPKRRKKSKQTKVEENGHQEQQQKNISISEAPHRDPMKELFNENKLLEKQVEQLSLFREIALTVNSTADFNNMLKILLDLLSVKYTDMNILIYLNREDGPHIVFFPMYGLVQHVIKPTGELADAGFKEYNEDDFEQLVEKEAPGRNILALKDGDLLFGAIIFERTAETKAVPDSQDMNFISSQITMAIKNSYLYSLAITDGLSGLYVHRYFQIKLEEEIRRAQRYKKTFALVIMDIDHFKGVNDTFGHQAGDYVIKAVCQIVKETIRKTDLAFRYGGDEIVVLMPETAMSNAFAVAEKMRSLIEQYKFMHQENQMSLTASLGVIAYQPALTKEEIVKRCDMALYRAKEEGRNRVVIAE